MRLLVLLLCIPTIFADSSEPSVIIVGAGPAGIAAASKLLQNGINNVQILEAEDRIGGSVYSKKFGEYWIDLGGQWVRGERDNVVYELASPLGLLSHSRSKESEPERLNMTVKFYGSNGNKVDASYSQFMLQVVKNLTTNWMGIANLQSGSVGEYMDTFYEVVLQNDSESRDTLKEPIVNLLDLTRVSTGNGRDWWKMSAKGARDYETCEGNNFVNWKERTYSTILDVLMKKYPKPEEELPVLNKTLLNKKVKKIAYGDDGPVNVITSDDSTYTADYVVFTQSLGVLKTNYESMFEPSLPEKKVNSIKNLEVGHGGKIYLYYENPWWTSGEDVYAKLIFWATNDRKEIENDPEKRWMLSVTTVIQVEYKPRLLCLWLSGPGVKEMEQLPEDLVKNQTSWLLNKFFGDSYTMTEPKMMARTNWNSNENFLGTYSYRSIDSDTFSATAADLGEPVVRNDKPVVLFAGEATEPKHYSTVNGDIESGWREADRIISLHKK